MAYTLISGNLTDPSGAAQAGARIIIVAQRNSSAAFSGMTVSQVTGPEGEYSFSLAEGYYRVAVSYNNDRRTVSVGDMKIESSSEPGTLNDYVRFADPVLATPTIYSEIKRLYENAQNIGSGLENNVAVVIEQTGIAAEKANEALSHAESAAAANGEALKAKDDALSAKELAVQASDQAKATIATAGLKKDIATGLSETTNGQYFSVAQGVNSSAAIITYLNNNGTAQEVSRLAGSALVEAAKLAADSVDARTQGLSTQKASTHPLEIVDSRGRLSLSVGEQGRTTAHGGLDSDDVKTKTLGAETADLNEIKSAGVTVGNSRMASQIGNWLNTEEDTAGRVVWGTRNDGQKVYLGQPLHNRPGLLNNDFFFIGDSITAFTETTSGAYNDTNRNEKPCVCDQGWPMWAEAFSDGVIKVAGVSATGGFRADQILSTHVPVAIAAKPSFCVVLAGRNNVVQNYTLAATIEPLGRIYQRLRQNGIVPVLCSMSAQTGNTDAQNQLRYQVNEWIRAYADRYSLPFVDMHTATTDPVTGDWYAGLNYDVSHPNGAGAKLMGQCLVDAMKGWVKPVKARIAANHSTPAGSNNLIPDPLFLNGGPDWQTVTAGTSTFTTDAAVKGNPWRLVGGRKYLTLNVDAGARYGFGFRWKTNNSQSNSLYVVSGASEQGNQYLSGMKRWVTPADSYGYFYREFVVPAGVTQLTIVFAASDMATAQMGLFKITEII